MSVELNEQQPASLITNQEMADKLAWHKPLIEDLQVAVGTQSVGLGNNDGSASHT